MYEGVLETSAPIAGRPAVSRTCEAAPRRASNACRSRPFRAPIR